MLTVLDKVQFCCLLILTFLLVIFLSNMTKKEHADIVVNSKRLKLMVQKVTHFDATAGKEHWDKPV